MPAALLPSPPPSAPAAVTPTQQQQQQLRRKRGPASTAASPTTASATSDTGPGPAAEPDEASDKARRQAFRAALFTLYRDEDDLFERQVKRPAAGFVPEPVLEKGENARALAGEDVAANGDSEADLLDQAFLQELRRPRAQPLLRLEEGHSDEHKRVASELASRQESTGDVNATLGTAQFYVDLVDKIEGDDGTSEHISIVIECHYYDSIDPFTKPVVLSREEIERTLYVRYAKTFAKVKRVLFEKLPALKSFVEANSSLRAIKLAVPRYEALSAMIMALTYSSDTRAESLEGENVFEVYAIANILGLEALLDQCRARMRQELSQGAAVLAGHLATKYGDLKLLEIVHGWIQTHLLETGKIAAVEADGILALEKQTLVFRRFRLHNSVFQDVVKEKMTRCLPYMTPSSMRESLRLIRERPADGSEAVYKLLKPDSNAVRLAAKYDAVRGEYIISRTANIGLHNEDYVGGIAFNIAGTCFTIFDSASKCTTYTGAALKGWDEARTELGAVLYVRNFFGWEPREFTIVLPKELKSIPQRPGSLLDFFTYDTKDFVHIRNRPPKWNEERATYTLDFRNHVKKASKKNFILETNDSELKEVMMMGKLDRDQFYVHYNEPLSLLVTFGICLSSFHKKRLVK